MPPSCGASLILPPTWKGSGAQDIVGYVANLITYGPTLLLSRVVKHWEPSKRPMTSTYPRTCVWGLILSPTLKHWRPPRWQGDVANPRTCGRVPTLSCTMKRRRPPKGKRLCSPSAHLWAHSDFVPRFGALGTAHTNGDVITPPTCGPISISPQLRTGGDSRMAGGMYLICPLVGPFSFGPPPQRVGHPPNSWDYVANLTTCGPLLKLFLPVRHWEPSKRRIICNLSRHLYVGSNFVPHSQALWRGGVMYQIRPLVG